MEDALSFSELRKIQKAEEREEKLTELGENFMLRVDDYFQQKKEIGDNREYKNAERVFKKIISLREDKIVRNAKIAANSNSSAPDNLLPFENELYRDLKNKFKIHRNKAMERKDVQVDQEIQREEDEEEDVEESGEDTGDGYRKIKATSEIPEFMGTDLESYGPLDKGEEINVPEENAEILVNRGNAEVIE